MNKKLLVSAFLCFFVFSLGMVATEKLKTYGPINLISSVSDGTIIFSEYDPPVPGVKGPSVPDHLKQTILAPITEKKEIRFETGGVTIPGGTIDSILVMHIYLYQLYEYRNDDQNIFKAFLRPYIILESPVFNEIFDPDTSEPLGRRRMWPRGLFLNVSKSLVENEYGSDERGNFRTIYLTEEGLDKMYGEGMGKEIFKNDLTVIMEVKCKVKGISYLRVGTMTLLYGY